MDLRPYVENIHHQLVAAAEAGGEDARVLAERLVAPLDAAVRLTLQDVLATAAEEITCELAPGSVELRLRGRDPEFVVTPPPTDSSVDGLSDGNEEQTSTNWPVSAMAHRASAEGDAGEMSRINLRMSDQLKVQVEHAASDEGLSVNAWLVRAATAALVRTDPGRPRDRGAARGGQHYTGWAR
jgi:predicted HicB family RNase H-like nuclease